ncbi:MAG: hypothetical protein MSC30_01520 [Gaiellaceae bacterium MAG52_C11]|nr:hypothetical protein [Candidatus Gaiellasilicea maunaloa]
MILAIRPQDFSDARAADNRRPTLEIETAVVEELGSATHLRFTIEAPPVDVDSVRAASDEGERATLLATDRRPRLRPTPLPRPGNRCEPGLGALAASAPTE